VGEPSSARSDCQRPTDNRLLPKKEEKKRGYVNVRENSPFIDQKYINKESVCNNTWRLDPGIPL
jgi:hypothetical protein